MSKIARKSALIFGSTAGANQIAQFGSLAASAPAFTTDPAVIQSLSNYLGGWFTGIIGANSPAIEDMNALCYLFAYQIAYSMQTGVAEWDSGTTYFKGSVVNDGSGNLYISLTDNNLNNAVTSTPNWYNNRINVVTITAASSPYTMTAADNGKTFLVNSLLGPVQFNLPTPNIAYTFSIQDIDIPPFGFGSNPAIIHRHGSERIQAVAADYVASAPSGKWVFCSDGTDWYF